MGKTRTHWAIKNSNLFEKLAPLDIFSNLEEIKENFPNQTIDLLNPTKNIGKLKAILNTNISIKITGTNTPKYIKDVPDFITRVIKINQIIDEKRKSRSLL